REFGLVRSAAGRQSAAVGALWQHAAHALSSKASAKVRTH
ncbi:LysR family transcriptional regulator, partial [Achromobacter xylosoxidans]